MFEVDETVTIARPIDEVWAFVIDETHDLLWQPTLTEVQRLTDGPLTVGAQVRETRSFLGRHVVTVWEMTECEEPVRSSIRSVKAPFAWGGTYSLSPEGDETRFTATLRGDTAGFFRLAEPVVHRIVRRELVGNLANLKDVLEAGPLVAVGEDVAVPAAS